MTLYAYYTAPGYYEMNIVYRKQYAKDIKIVLERNMNEPNKLTLNGITHTSWGVLHAPRMIQATPLQVVRYIPKSKLANPKSFMKMLSDLIEQEFDDPGYLMY
jgi:hypothetical protein